MGNFEFEGKKYYEAEMETQIALDAVSIYTFRYYIQDDVLLFSDLAAKRYNTEKCYKNASDFRVKDTIYPSDRECIEKIYEGIRRGDKFICQITRTLDGQNYIKITLSVIKYDDNGNPLIYAGVINEFDDQMHMTELIKMLSIEYESAYLVDFSNNQVSVLKLGSFIDANYGEKFKQMPSYNKMMSLYIENEVVAEEKAEVTANTSYKNLNEQLKDRRTYTYDFRILRDNKIRYIRLKAVRITDKGDITKVVMGFSDISDEKRREWEHIAYKDTVTGGNNYNYYIQRIKYESRTGYVLSMDIKSFKIVNSLCGIGRGDEVLKSVSEILTEMLKGKGFCGHVNADRFVFFLALESDEEVVSFVESLTSEIELLAAWFNVPQIRPFFGITRWRVGMRTQIILSEAETAKKNVKSKNDINYAFYCVEDEARAIEDKELENAFKEAIDKNEFEIWYQPKYNPKDESLIGAEALVRWRKADGTLISPGRFVPLFEKDGHIVTLDNYVFTQVCHQQKQWEEKYGNVVPISVNLSRASLYYETIVDTYKDIADTIKINPELVPIEITESAAVDSTDIKNLAARFINAGFALHVDDFGSGYSSLSTLNMMSFQTLKLDKSLIDYIGNYGGDMLIKHTIALARDLGLHVTAEGVESAEQVGFLKDIGCDSIQGFYYDKPMPAQEFEKKLL